jgi:hypothetical protein
MTLGFKMTLNLWALAPLVSLVVAAGCTGNDGPLSTDIGGRELRPPRAGINVGSLYFVREAPTNDLSRPANLERLCDANLAVYNVAPVSAAVADIDLLRNLEASGYLNVVKSVLLNVGLAGNVSRYFEYKLVNVTQTDISLQDAQNIFDARAFRRDCTTWRGNIAGQNWAQYQVIAIKTGDIEFRRKTGFGLGADIAVKLEAVEPALKAAIKRETGANFSGKGVVAVFSPIPRNT